MNGMGWMSRHALLFLLEEHKKDNGGGAAAADYRFVEQASRPPFFLVILANEQILSACVSCVIQKFTLSLGFLLFCSSSRIVFLRMPSFLKGTKATPSMETRIWGEQKKTQHQANKNKGNFKEETITARFFHSLPAKKAFSMEFSPKEHLKWDRPTTEDEGTWQVILYRNKTETGLTEIN